MVWKMWLERLFYDKKKKKINKKILFELSE